MRREGNVNKGGGADRVVPRPLHVDKYVSSCKNPRLTSCGSLDFILDAPPPGHKEGHEVPAVILLDVSLAC